MAKKILSSLATYCAFLPGELLLLDSQLRLGVLQGHPMYPKIGVLEVDMTCARLVQNTLASMDVNVLL